MGCASSIHISDRVVYHSGKESEDSHSPQQTNATQHQGNPVSGLPLKAPNCKVREPALITKTQRMKCLFFQGSMLSYIEFPPSLWLIYDLFTVHFQGLN